MGFSIRTGDAGRDGREALGDMELVGGRQYDPIGPVSREIGVEIAIPWGAKRLGRRIGIDDGSEFQHTRHRRQVPATDEPGADQRDAWPHAKSALNRSIQSRKPASKSPVPGW